MRKYKVRETVGMFGDFNGCNRLRWKKPDVTITASGAEHAVSRYMRRYRRLCKQRNEHERLHGYDETTQGWGTLMVTDEKGFRTFYR